MGVEIKSEHIDIGGKNVLLVSVRGGSAVIGSCTAGYGSKQGDTSALSRLFYIGNDPAVEILCPNRGSKNSDKLISMCTGYSFMDEEIHDTLTESFNRVNGGDSLEAGLHDTLALLPDGVYTIYLSDYYTTDGAGTFFWGAYNLTHEIHGTAEHNRTIGKGKTYRPCFLIPGAPLDNFDSKTLNVINDAVRTRTVQGVVYHLSGLHSVLLKGHHGAVSCTIEKIPFRCAVIEKLDEPYTETYIPPVSEPVTAEEQQEGDEATEAQPEQSAPVEVSMREGITGFRSASVKVPLELIPRDMLRVLLENRFEYKPDHYNSMRRKVSMVRKKSYSNKVIPRPALELAEQMPDCEMMESVFTVEKLSQAQLDALLSGETELNGEIIISPNFYSSIVTACNFLQFTNQKKFVEFSLAILANPELYATHEYIANRISRLVSKEVYEFFRAVIENNDPGYDKIMHIAQKYVSFYEKQMAG
ncbi:MAG: hypothetical protein ACI4WS_04525 [Oscillospiraceae bacterium]